MAGFDTFPKSTKSQPLPYRVAVPKERVAELKQLLTLSKIAPPTYENLHAEPLEGKFGLTREWLVNAKKEWEAFDWRSVEDSLNSFPNYKLKIGETDLHFLALFSEKPDAVPLLLLHGWPGSILEFISLLSLMRTQYSPKDLPFHLIVPSLPGYGFSSGPPLHRKFTMLEAADILNSLMLELGFGATGYVAQGGDVGSRISRLLGAKHEACKAVHLNFCFMPRPESISIESLTEAERAGVERGMAFVATESAYAKEHASRPATIGLVLSTNPLALLAWIGEKFLEWTDETPSLNDILASVSLYWLTDTFPRAIYPYRESYGPNPTHHGTPSLYINKPLGYSCFPKEVYPVPVSWVATTGELCWSKVHTKGGHFAALERPNAIKDDLESFVAQDMRYENVKASMRNCWYDEYAWFAEKVSLLLRDGGLIVEDMFTPSHIQEMLTTIEPHLPGTHHDFAYQTPGTFFPQETKLLWSLVARGPAVGHRVCFHPLLKGLRDQLLHMHITRTNNAGSDDMQTKHTDIPPRLSVSVCFDMRPGAKQQPLHRDEDVWGTRHDTPFRREDIRQIGILIAGTKSTRENGATLVIPRSHLWDDERLPTDGEAAYAEMEPGSALIFLSSTRHAGGANRIQDVTDPLARRVMFSYFFAKGYLRQEENMLVSIPREVVLKMEPEMQALIGYEASGSHCGFVDFKSPLDIGLEKIFARTAETF